MTVGNQFIKLKHAVVHLTFLTALVGWSAVYAQPNITVETDSGAVAAVVTIDYDYTALDADDVSGLQFEIAYDPANLAVDSLANCLNGVPGSHGFSTCTEPNGADGGVIRIIIASGTSAELDDGDGDPFDFVPMGQIDFEILQSGTHPLTVDEMAPGSGFFNAMAQPVPGTFTDGGLTGAIVGAAGYGSVPAPGSTIDFGDVEVGVANPMAMAVSVSETGDQQLDVMAPAFTTGTDFASATAAFSIADGGPAEAVEVTCTPTTRGALTDTVTLGNNSVNAPAAAYPLTCNGTSPNVMVDPVAIMLNGVIGLADPSETFDVSNPQDGSASDATNATLAEATAGGPITFAPATFTGGTIAVDETETITVSCDATTAGMSTDTITITWDQSDAAGGTMSQDVAVTCDIINEIPEYESVPAEGTTIDFGAVLNGTTSAPMGVDVGNSNTDAVPNGMLMISGSTITGDPEFNLDDDGAGTTVADGVGPDGTDDIVVSCSPSDNVSTFTATLSVMSNDPDSPHDYPLTCDGMGDAAFSSTPMAGPVDLGLFLPGMGADSTITFSNDGTVEDLDVDCDLTGDPAITLISPAFPVTITPGATQDVVVNCTVPNPGLFSADLSCDVTDEQGATVASPVFNLSCVGQAVEVPTLSRFGLIAMIMTLLMGGFIAFRLRSN